MCSQSEGSSAWARVANAVDAVDLVDRRQQPGEADPALQSQIAAVAVDVLAQQRHLADAVSGQALDLGHDLAGIAALLATAGRGDDAVRADAVASL
jgi:hypothetical protein